MRLRSFFTFFLTCAAVGGAAFYVLTAPSPIVSGPLPARVANLANGEDMFNVGGCASCHATPKQDDHHRLGGGVALATAFGTFLTPNISPDPRFGIGSWSEEEFVNATLRGIGRNGEHLYPAFPYTSYQRLTVDDARDLFAYLKTLPADATPSLPHKLPLPFKLRRGIGLWKLLNLDGKTFASDPAKSAVLNRGAYLVEGPGHCAECHSPRNVFGGIIKERRFSGGPDPEGKGWIPNITPHADGIGSWTEGDIAYLLELGLTPDANAVASSMADVVQNTAKLQATDRKAMAAYLKSLPPLPGKAPPRKN